MGSAVSGVRNWVYDLFGRRTGGRTPGQRPRRRAGHRRDTRRVGPRQAQQPEITEAPLLPLENATPRSPCRPSPMTKSRRPRAPEVAPVPQPGVVITTPPPPQPQPQPGIVVTTPVQRGAVVPAPVPARGNAVLRGNAPLRLSLSPCPPRTPERSALRGVAPLFDVDAVHAEGARLCGRQRSAPAFP